MRSNGRFKTMSKLQRTSTAVVSGRGRRPYAQWTIWTPCCLTAPSCWAVSMTASDSTRLWIKYSATWSQPGVSQPPQQDSDRGIPGVILRQGLSCASSGRLSEPPAAVIISHVPSSFRQALEHQLLQLAHDTLALLRDELQMSKAVHAANRGTDSGVSIQIRHLHA